MEKGFNLSVLDFKKAVIAAINNSNLPISVVNMVIEEVAREVKATEVSVLEAEIKTYEDGLKSENDAVMDPNN